MSNLSQVSSNVGSYALQGLYAEAPTQQAAGQQAGVDTSRGYPVGDGTFADSVAGTDPQSGRDLHFSLMAHNTYISEDEISQWKQDGSPNDDRAEVIAATSASASELEAAGWTRLEPAGDHLVDANGNQIPIDPSKLRDPQSGFDAAIYQNEDGQYVVAYRGTDSWSLGEGGDALTNGGQGGGFEIEQYQQAMELAKIATATFGEGNVAFTGHSLGGGLASAAMLAVDAPGVTFNAAGLSDNTLRELGYNPNEIRDQLAESGQIRRYNIEFELLTTIQQGTPLPDAVGHELRIAAPEGTGISPITRHGGGKTPTFVDALRENTPYRPLDLSGTTVGLTMDTLENFGEFNLNMIGSLARNGIGLVTDAASTIGDAGREIGDVFGNEFADGRYIEGGVKIVGDVVDGAFDVAGDAVNNTADFAGDIVLETTNFGGNVLRNLGDWTGVDAPFDAAASVVEGAGQLINGGIDALGDGLDWGLNTLGDGVEWVVDTAGAGAQWTGDRIADGARWLGDRAVDTAELVVDGVKWTAERTVEAAQWTGERIVEGVEVVVEGVQWTGERVADGVKWTSDRIVDGVQWTGERIADGVEIVADGVKWTGDRIADGAEAVVDGAKWLGEKLNPLNWF